MITSAADQSLCSRGPVYLSGTHWFRLLLIKSLVSWSLICVEYSLVTSAADQCLRSRGLVYVSGTHWLRLLLIKVFVLVVFDMCQVLIGYVCC